MSETILIVDDEESVRRTFRDWLAEAALDCRTLAAADAEEALRLANQGPIDLAVLDWNLGAGDDGLQLLQDLSAFHPDVTAILVTGYANQATPLDAMRMGVRDYLDKNHDLNRDTFLAAVRKQLEQIRPAKRARALHRSLAAFREAVEKILPLVQSTTALNDPVPLPDAVRALVRFVVQATRARDGVLLVRHYDAGREPAEIFRAYGADGRDLPEPTVPFARSVAGTVVSLAQPSVMNDLGDPAAGGTVELQPFEQGRRNLLAVPLLVAPGIQAVIELFDKPDPFRPDDQRLARAAAEVGTELLRQALGQRQAQELLLDALGAALGASEQVAQTLAPQPEEPPPDAVMAQLRAGLSESGRDDGTAEVRLRLAEAIRVLSLRHGKPALEHCARLVEDLRRLLDDVTGV